MEVDEQVWSAVLEAVEETNRPLSEEHRIGEDPGTVLLGDGSKLDSLGLVSLIVAIEGRLRDRLGVTLALVDGQALDSAQSPFRTLESLARHVESKLKEIAG